MNIQISESNQSTSKLTSTTKNVGAILLTSIELILNLIRLAYKSIKIRAVHGLVLSACQL